MNNNLQECENKALCNDFNLCRICQHKVRQQYFSNQNTSHSSQQFQQSSLQKQGFNDLNQNQQKSNQNQPSGQQVSQEVQPPVNAPPQNPPPVPQGQQLNQNPPQGQNPKPPAQINQQMQQVQNQMQNFINFKLDAYPKNKFSISQNPQMVSILYSLNFDKLFQNVIHYSQNLVRGELYSNDPTSQVNLTSFSDIQNIQPLQNQKPNKFIQFFHCLNMMMSNTYFISIEQIIQHAILNVREPEIIELALSRNKLFDIDNFIGAIQNNTSQVYRLEKFQSKSKNDLLHESQMQGKIIDFLFQEDKTPILIQTIDNEKQDFIVIKQYKGEWYLLSQDSNTQKITKKGKKYLSDLSEAVDEINQQDLIKQYFGSINIFYCVKLQNSSQRKTEQVLINMFQLIYRQKKYAEQLVFWNEFITLAEQQLKLPDIQNNKFQLPQIRYNPTNFYSNQLTQNQVKQQKKRAANQKFQGNSNSDSDTDTTPKNTPKSGKNSTPTRSKNANQTQLNNKRQKQ
ncbi:hypothetical protein OXYTRIMIC_031 [Oxytricha trifallax]|uniref:Uncharacterized protein n=1 Tax=Oxytricha trifallax TaxID=1172189 RepID=A0A073I0G0_9SPIT|nr:hypothetical protein OXYTRIMIC_031 [Oxytricha trifallax]